MASSSDRQQKLAEAVEALYRAFSPYPLVRHVEGCPCCVSASDESQIHSKSLRAITADELHRYAFKAMTTWGTTEDFKHFLPRLFELVTAEESIADQIDVEVLFGKLTYAKWQQWPLQEQKAVKDYLDTLWSFLLSLSPEVVALDSFVCAYGQAVDDLAPYLEVWANRRTAFSLRHYFDFFGWNEAEMRRRNLKNAFWSGRREQMRQVVDWATSPETEVKMEQTLGVIGDDGDRI